MAERQDFVDKDGFGSLAGVPAYPMTEHRRQGWNLLLQELAGDGLVPEPGSVREECLRILGTQFATLTRIPEPVLTTPLWLTGQAWQAFLEESRSVRGRAVQGGRQWMAHGGRISQAVCLSPTLLTWARSATGVPLEPDVRSTYLYYENAGDSSPIHVDRADGYEVHLLIMLEHKVAPGAEPSTTFVVTPDGVSHIRIPDGEALFFQASTTLHGRTPLGEGERVSLLSLGFRIATEGSTR